jgi:N-acetylglucosamine repressor
MPRRFGEHGISARTGRPLRAAGTPAGEAMKHVQGKRERDKHVIQAVVREFGPISRSAIHELTHIRRSTTSGLVKQLLEEGRLVEAGRIASRSQTGRKQLLLRINENHRWVAAVEFDEEYVMAGMLDLHPNIRHTVTEPTDLRNGRSGLIKQLVSCTRRALRQAGRSAPPLLAVGIADPGLVDSRSGVTVTSSTIEFWRDVPLKAIFEKEFEVPALVEAKARTKAVAERLLGAGEMLDSMIYVDYGAGIGTGIIADGKLLYGQNCAAGEFGHTHTMEDGPACKCGSFGCLEAVAGARAVEARIRKAVEQGGWTEALAMAAGDSKNVSVWTALKAASQGDKICSNILAEVAGYLGLGIANLVNLFNPSVVVLDQRLELAGQPLLDQLVQIVKRQALTYSSERVRLRFGRFGREGGILGVTLMILENHFEIPRLKPPRFLVEPIAQQYKRDGAEQQLPTAVAG